MRSTPHHIREALALREGTYDVSRAAQYLVMSIEELQTALDRGEYAAVRAGEAWLLTWRHIVRIAMARWSMPEIEKALGQAMSRLPLRLRTKSLAVRIPEYLLLMLEERAAAEDRTLEHVVADLLRAGLLVGLDPYPLEQKHRGIIKAMCFPDLS